MKVSRFWLLALLVLSALVLGLLALFAKPRQLSDCDYERTGLWDLCKRGSGLYFEIPRALIDKELLVVETAGKVTAGIKEPPVKYHLFRWQLRDDHMVAQLRMPQNFADQSGTLLDDIKAPSVWRDAAVLPVISGSFLGDVGVNATPLFRGPLMLSGQVIDADATQFTRTLSFPRNVVIQTRTLVSGAQESERIAPREWNFVVLPERPMLPRRLDPRHPFFSIDVLTGDMMLEAGKQLHQDLALRWRLEKKNPEQALSEPVNPIVYYIDPTTPKKWRPYVKQAIEAWNTAFEEAGFRNAIVAREAPADDPDFGFDIRHTVLVWDSQEWMNRMIVDPRTGQILQGNLMPAAKGTITRAEDGYTNWQAKHFVRAAAIDPDARKFPFDLDLEARLMGQVASHEMGHNLGLKDGSYGKGVYTVAQVRDPDWVQRNGFTPSIMNYSRMNYVAQPEDNMPSELLIQQVGPADRYWIKVLYQVFPDVHSVQDEAAPMEALLRQLESRPELRFNEGHYAGPDSALEVVETSDPVTATRLGLLNLKRAIELAPTALARGSDTGRGDAMMLQKAAMSTWYDLMHHVVTLVGGYTQRIHGKRDPGPVRTMVPAEKQREAMRFLLEEAFVPPTWLRDPALSRLLPEAWRRSSEDDLQAVLSAQRLILHEMIGSGHGNAAQRRLSRLAAAETGSAHYVYPDEGRYTLSEFLSDLRKGIWSELKAGTVTIDPYRQGLQQAHVQFLKETLAIQKDDKSGGEVRAWFGKRKVPLHAFISNAVAADLQVLSQALRAADGKAQDPTTAAHLKRMRALIGTLQLGLPPSA